MMRLYFNKGFTLFELLVTLVIAAISLTAMSPCMKASYDWIKTACVIDQVTHEIHYTRDLAIGRQEQIRYCNGGNDENWGMKRIIINKEGKIMHCFKSLPVKYQLTLNNSLAQNNCLVFTSFGFTLSQRGSFYLRTPSGDKRLTIIPSGRIRIEDQPSVFS